MNLHVLLEPQLRRGGAAPADLLPSSLFRLLQAVPLTFPALNYNTEIDGFPD